MERLRGPEKEVQVLLDKFVPVLLLYELQCRWLVISGLAETIPVQGTNFPVEDLQLSRLANLILEAVRETVGQFRDDLERLPPRLIIEKPQLSRPRLHLRQFRRVPFAFFRLPRETQQPRRLEDCQRHRVCFCPFDKFFQLRIDTTSLQQQAAPSTPILIRVHVPCWDQLGGVIGPERLWSGI